MPAHRAEEVTAVVVDLELHVLELELRKAALARNHRCLNSNQGIATIGSRVELNYRRGFARDFNRHQYVSMLAIRAIKAKTLVVNFYFGLLDSERRFILFASKHHQLRVNRKS